MHYVLSDVHGEYDRYLAMLNRIQFSDDDILYVIGDVIDRAPDGVLVLKDIMARPNVQMLLGNHEQMCLDTIGPNYQYGARQLWQENGGSSTYRHLIYKTSKEDRHRILEFLERLPRALDVEVGGRNFHLVHAWPGDTDDCRLWSRPSQDWENPFSDDRCVIIGHTPVCYLERPKDYCDFLDEVSEAGSHLKIFHAAHFIDIDCGCGNRTPVRRLACLRLEDMKEFYT